MPTTIDKKIVEMRFNNADFERNAAQSMRTVDKLKQSMKFDDSGDAIARIAKSVENLEARFSTLGIVGKRVIENITDSVINLERKFTGFIVNGVKSGGITRAMNLENARFTMQGLLKDETAVEQVMAAVGNSVDGTAYSLDQAATIAAQFVASGKQADEIEGALKGVAGAAAVTNSDFSSMGRIFAQVAGQGRLMGNDLLQLSTRGLNAAATMADFFNAINSGDESVANVSDEVKAMVKDITAGATQTEATVRDLVSKSKVSFDIFAASMNNAFADQAAKANDTFTGSLSNIKAALGRIGAEFVSPLIKQQGPFVKLFNTIREKINDVKKVLTTDKDSGNFLSPAASFVKVVSTALSNLESKIKNLNINKIVRPMYAIQWTIRNIYLAVKDVIGIGKNAFKDVFPNASVLKTITSVSERIEKLTRNLRPSADTADKLRRVFKGFFSVISVGIGAVKSFVKILGPDMLSAFKSGIGIALDFAARIGDFFSKVSGWVQEGKTFERIFTFIHNAIQSVKTVLEPVGNIFRNVFSTIGSLVSDFIKTFTKVDFKTALLNLFKSIGSIIKNNWDRPFKFIKSELSKFGQFLDRWLTNLNIYKNIKAFLTKVKDTIVDSSVFQFILNAFTKLKDGIASIINSFGDVDTSGAGEMDKKLSEEFTWLNKIGSFLSKVGNAILTAGKFIWNAIKTVGTWVYDAVKNSGLGKAINNLISNSDLADVGLGGAGIALATVFLELKKIFKEGGKIIEGVGKITGNFATILGDIHDTLNAFQKSLKADAIKKIATSIAILAGSLFVLAIIPAESLSKGIVAITILMENLSRVMQTFGKLSAANTNNPTDIKGGLAGFLGNLGNSALSIGGQFLLFAGAITTLTIALGVLGSMDYETILKGIVMVTILIKALTSAVSQISKAGKNGPKAAATIMALSVAVNLLIAPILTMALIISRSVGAMSAVMAGVGVVSALLSMIVLEVGAMIDAATRYGKGFNIGKARSIAIMMGLMAVMMELITANVLVLGLAASSLEVDTKYVKGSVGGADKLIVAGSVIAGLLGAVLGVLAGLMEATKKFGSSEKVLDYRVKALTSMIKIAVATMAAITGLLLVLELATGEISIETKKVKTSVGGTGRLESGAKAVTMVLGGVLVFISTMLFVIDKINKTKVGKKGSSVTDDLKNVAIFVAGAAAAITLIASAITNIAKKVDVGKGWNAVLMITAVIGLIAALATVASLPFVSAGLSTLANTFVLFAIGAVGFAASIFIITEAFNLLADNSKENIKKVGKNLGLLADQIADAAPRWANAIAILLSSVLQTVVETIALGWKNIIVSIIDILYQTFDALDGQVPMIIARLTTLIVEVVDALIPNLGIIVDKLLTVVINLINAIADAIDNHRDEILDAVGRLFDAIGRLVADAIGRATGKTGKELKKFVETWGPKFKKLGEIIAGIFITTKIFGGIKKMGSAIKAVYGATKTFVTGIKDGISFFKTFRAEGSSAFEALKLTAERANKQGLAKLLAGGEKLAAMFGGHGLLVTAIAAGALAAATKFAIYVHEMEVVGDAESKIVAKQDEIKRSAEAAFESATQGATDFKKELEKIPSSIGDTVDVDAYMSKFKEIFNPDGTIIKGMEEAANDFLPTINSELGTKYTLVDNTLTLEGQSLSSYEDMEASLKKVNQQLRHKAILESYKGKYQEAMEKMTELPSEMAKAQEDYNKAYQKYLDINDEAAQIDALKDVDIRSKYLGFFNDFGGDEDATKEAFISWYKGRKKLIEKYGGELEKSAETAYLNVKGGVSYTFDDITEDYSIVTDKAAKSVIKAEESAEKLKSTYDGLVSSYEDFDLMISNYEDFSQAVASGNEELAENSMRALQNSIGDTRKLSSEQLEAERKAVGQEYDKLLELAKDHNKKVSKDAADNTAYKLRLYSEEAAFRARYLLGNEMLATAIEKSTQTRIDALYAYVEKASDATKEAEESSGSWLDSLANGLKTKLSDVSGFDMSDFKDNLIDSGKFDKSDIDKLTSGMDISSAAEALGIGGEELGDYLTKGVNTGIKAGSSESKDTAVKYINDVLSSTNAAAGIASPSKKTYETGKYLVMGLANGITQNMLLSMAAASKMATMTINAVKYALANQGKVGIKPIVDLSAIQNGSIQGMLNGQALALNGNVSSQIAASINSTEFEAQMDRISDQLAAMHNDMITIGNYTNKGLSQLGTTINGMQVVMNTGALVGQIAAPMDTALGNRAILKKRGI